jgi:hypothetical protein
VCCYYVTICTIYSECARFNYSWCAILFSIIDWNLVCSHWFSRISFRKKEESISSLVVAKVTGTVSVFVVGTNTPSCTQRCLTGDVSLSSLSEEQMSSGDGTIIALRPRRLLLVSQACIPCNVSWTSCTWYANLWVRFAPFPVFIYSGNMTQDRRSSEHTTYVRPWSTHQG